MDYVDNNNIYSEDINNNKKNYSNDNNFPNSNTNTKRDTNMNTGSMNNNNNLFPNNNGRTGSNFGISNYGDQFSSSGNFNRNNPDNNNLGSIIGSNSNNPNQRGNNTFEEERKGRSSMPNNIIDNLSLSESRERGGFSVTDENMENKHNFNNGDNQNPNFNSQDGQDFNRINDDKLQNLRNGNNNTNSNQNRDNNNLINNNIIDNGDGHGNVNDINDLVKTGEQHNVEYNILVDNKQKEILSEEGRPFIGEQAQETNVGGNNFKIKKKTEKV
jgi:transcriptional adapter 2-alpha